MISFSQRVYVVLIYTSIDLTCGTLIIKPTRIHWLDHRIVKKQLEIMLNYRYVQNQGKIKMPSRENDQKLQFWQFLDDFEVKYLQIANFSEK